MNFHQLRTWSTFWEQVMVSGIVCYNLAILRIHHKRKNSADGCDQEVSSQTGVQFPGTEISLLALQICFLLRLFSFLSDLLFQFRGFFPFLPRFNFGIYFLFWL